ncbi:MAG: putative outer rane phospholipase, partial [Sphingomonas bacterium]|nr:putative outer rane phospholipase [Sphingomonas bacterium]
MKRLILAGALLPFLAGAGLAQAPVAPGVQALVSAITPAADRAAMHVELTFLNGGSAGFTPPARIAATIDTGGRSASVELVRAAPEGRRAAAGGFVRAGYALALPADSAPGAAATLTLAIAPGSDGAPAYAFHLPADARAASTGAAGAALAAAIPAPAPAPVSTKPEQGNAFLGNLSSYAPI